MALIEFSSGRINSTLNVVRHVFPEKHVFFWTWRDQEYFLDSAEGVGIIGSRVIDAAEYFGEKGADPVFSIFRRQILHADGIGAFDADDVASVPDPDDPTDIPGDPKQTPGDGNDSGGPGGTNPNNPPPPEEPLMPEQQISAMSVAALPVALALLKQVGFTIAKNLRVPWNAIPGWARTILVSLGAIEGADFILDVIDGDGFDFGIGPFQIPVGQGGGDPITAMVEAMTVSTWHANGVTFHRLSDGRLATRKKTGVWKIWRPRKPIVLFASGNSNLKDVLKADRILQKEAKKIAKLLKNRGWKVART